MKQSGSRGFTLIEVMVTITIIAILSAIVLANMGGSSARGRDADRKADLRILQSAIESYKQTNGRYPAKGSCTDIAPADGLSSERECGSNPYIVGLAPDFISTLPKDPRRSATQHGFAYITNANGTSYKLMVMDTVETETMTATSQMRSCDIGVTNSICTVTTVCNPATSARFRTSYGVWGGYADGVDEAAVRTNTRAVICQ